MTVVTVLTLLLLLAAALNGSLLAAVGLCAAFVWACGTRQR